MVDGSPVAILRRLFAALLLALLLGAATPADAQRIMDLGRVEGVRHVMLKGPGLVIGLPGTGDSAKSPITRELYGAFFENLGIPVPEDAIRSRNVALVMVTARVPSTTKLGSSIEVTVSSIGDAKSLKGGWLLETALGKAGHGIQGSASDPVVALAQGGVEASGEVATVGRATGILEAAVDFQFVPEGDSFTIILNQPDFASASRVARAINEFPWLRYLAAEQRPIAHAADSGSVEVTIPEQFRAPKQIVDFISRIMGEVQVPQADQEATVVIDSRTGMVTVNGNVRVKKVVVLWGSMEIRIDSSNDPAENQFLIEVIDSLRDKGVTNQDLPAIIRNIQRAGALVGKLVEQ